MIETAFHELVINREFSLKCGLLSMDEKKSFFTLNSSGATLACSRLGKSVSNRLERPNLKQTKELSVTWRDGFGGEERALTL